MTQALCLAVALAAAQAEKPGPPPLTEEQIARIRKLASDTQKESARLKALLEERQKELADVYGKYELDEKRATKASWPPAVAPSALPAVPSGMLLEVVSPAMRTSPLTGSMATPHTVSMAEPP